MSAAPTRSFTRLTVAIVVAAVVIAATVLSYSSLEATTTKTVTSAGGFTNYTNTQTTTATITTTSTSTETVAFGAQTISAEPLVLSKSWGPWVYNVSISATLVNPGQFIVVSGDLTYMGQNETEISWPYPDISLIAYNSNGSTVWEEPAPAQTSGVGTLVENATPGRNLGGGQACIPISTDAQSNSCSSSLVFTQTPRPGTYSMQIEVPFYSYPGDQNLGTNLIITADFVVLSNSSLSVSQTSTTTSFECVITGQPGGLFLRVVSDSDQTPVAGAIVNATNKPAYCDQTQATSQETTIFTTSSSTQWYPLNTENDAGYSFAITYSGQTYSFSAGLSPLSVTCATLFVPSGRTNVTTTEFQTAC